jgi:hypothetical protein
VSNQTLRLLLEGQVGVREAEYADTALLHRLPLQRSSTNPVVLAENDHAAFSRIRDPLDVFRQLRLVFAIDVRQRINRQTRFAQRPGDRNLPEASIDEELRQLGVWLG